VCEGDRSVWRWQEKCVDVAVWTWSTAWIKIIKCLGDSRTGEGIKVILILAKSTGVDSSCITASLQVFIGL